MDARLEFSRQLPDWVDRIWRNETGPYALIDQQVAELLDNPADSTTPRHATRNRLNSAPNSRPPDPTPDPNTAPPAPNRNKKDNP